MYEKRRVAPLVQCFAVRAVQGPPVGLARDVTAAVSHLGNLAHTAAGPAPETVQTDWALRYTDLTDHTATPALSIFVFLFGMVKWLVLLRLNILG